MAPVRGCRDGRQDSKGDLYKMILRFTLRSKEGSTVKLFKSAFPKESEDVPLVTSSSGDLKIVGNRIRRCSKRFGKSLKRNI